MRDPSGRWRRWQYWRHVTKALSVLDYLIKNGSETVVDIANRHLAEIKTLKVRFEPVDDAPTEAGGHICSPACAWALAAAGVRVRGPQDFQYIDEDGKDQGVNVRHKSKEVASLLQDPDRIKEERIKAKQLRERLAGRSHASSDDVGGSRREEYSYSSRCVRVACRWGPRHRAPILKGGGGVSLLAAHHAWRPPRPCLTACRPHLMQRAPRGRGGAHDKLSTGDVEPQRRGQRRPRRRLQACDGRQSANLRK